MLISALKVTSLFHGNDDQMVTEIKVGTVENKTTQVKFVTVAYSFERVVTRPVYWLKAVLCYSPHAFLSKSDYRKF